MTITFRPHQTEGVQARNKRWYAKNKDSMSKAAKNRYATDPKFRDLKKAAARKNGAQWTRKAMMTPEGRAKRLWTATRSRCRREHIPFTLTLAHVTAAIKAGVCPKTGAKFDLWWPEVGAPRLGARVNSFAPSLDRKDANKGYTDENVQVVAWWYNCAKGEISELELQAWCRQVLRTAKRK